MRPGMSKKSGRARLILLSLGALLGLLLAARDLVDRTSLRSTGLPEDIIARVGNRDISLDRFRSVLADLGADRRAPLVAADRDFALQRLVDEELLLLQGIEMGLVDSLPEVRKAVVSAVIAQTVAEAEAVQPTEKQLRELYAADSDFFTSAARYRVVWLRGIGPAESAPARLASTQLNAGMATDKVAAATGLERVVELADVPMPLAKLRDYLGPSLAQAVTQLTPGTATQPLSADGRVHVLFLVEARPLQAPPFDDIRPLVEAEFTRRQGDAALQRHLERLRRENEIIIGADRTVLP
jgi:hypothetical protein